jgi:serine/threonine protein kinase/tetratricopeptide (TPR) repeat protein
MSQADQREEAVFEAALQLAPAERAAHLDRTCGDNVDLRRRVEGLLAAFDRAGGFLKDSGASANARTLADSVPVSEKPGDRIGRYKLLQQIGEGGCGVVYMSEQEEPVHRRVALKVIKQGMDTKQVMARFEAEQQALALMDHPNIARVLDAGATDTGRPYFVMELVRGIKITEFCDQHKLSTDDRLHLFVQVCRAVQHAHQKGVIHRDLKPSNVLVSLNDGVPVPKVIDFGIAKATQGRLTTQTLFTAFEQFIGTPAYMSPEQAVMTSLDIDTRSDIYSLGVMLYELLTGKTPFDTQELMRAGFDEMRRTIREKEPPRPSTRLSSLKEVELTTTAERRHTDAPKLVHGVRGDLDWIVMRCLEKDRSRRYETANGLARDIERHLASEPVAARPPSALYRLQKSVHRNKTAYTAVAAVALALVMGVVVSTSQAIRAWKEERKSAQVSQFLKDMLRGVKPSVAKGQDTTMLREILDATAARVGRDLKNLPEVEAELRSTMGEVYHYLGRPAEAEAMYRRALELSQQLHGPDHPEVAQVMNNLAVTLVSWDKLEEAEPLYRKALTIRKSRLGEKDLSVAETLGNLSFLLRREFRLEEAEAAIREALTIQQAKLGDSPEVAESLRGLGAVLWRQKKLPEAEAKMLEGLALQTKLMGPDDPVVSDMTEDVGLVLEEQGRHADAEKTLEEALAARRRLFGDTHRDTLSCMVSLVYTLLAEGKYAQAEPLARECWTTRKKIMPDEAKTFNVESIYGGCLLGLKNYRDAEPRVLSGYEGLTRPGTRIPPEGWYVVTNALQRIVQLYEETRRPDEAARWKQKLAEAGKGPPNSRQP